MQGGLPVYPSYSRQYRSAILVHNDVQMAAAVEVIDELKGARSSERVYCDIESATDFYRAEEYHQKYVDKSSARGGSRWS